MPRALSIVILSRGAGTSAGSVVEEPDRPRTPPGVGTPLWAVGHPPRRHPHRSRLLRHGRRWPVGTYEVKQRPSLFSPAWERCRSSELPWWKALTEGFTRCRFHVETTDRTLEEVLAWFSQAMGPTLAALYCAVGPEWINNVIQAGSSRWKPQHYQLMKKPKPKRPYLLKAT